MADLAAGAVEQLDFPALDGALAGGGGDEPAGGGGVNSGGRTVGTNEDTEAVAGLGGQLQSSSLNLGEPRGGCNHGRNGATSQTINDHA